MIRGVFRSFSHDHYFETRGLRTIMRDDVKLAAPLGLLGVIAEKTLVERHMRGLLLKRNAEIKRAAESDAWKTFLK
jgi:ligand-binding SRPBCC domain-containing protein